MYSKEYWIFLETLNYPEKNKLQHLSPKPDLTIGFFLLQVVENSNLKH